MSHLLIGPPGIKPAPRAFRHQPPGAFGAAMASIGQRQGARGACQQLGAGMAGASACAASQHAVEGLTKSAALEVAAQGVRVHAVAPGPVETAMLTRFSGGNAEAKAGLLGTEPARRGATPEAITQTIVFGASD